MNAAEAKRSLGGMRPVGADNQDPRFREALRVAQQDPELAAWLKEQRGFDRLLARSLKSVAAPADLKAEILGSRETVRPSGRPVARLLLRSLFPGRLPRLIPSR